MTRKDYERIDVLAVIGGAAAVLDTPTPCETAKLLREARIAVAELIERERVLREFVQSLVMPAEREARAAISRAIISKDARAALARVGGG